MIPEQRLHPAQVAEFLLPHRGDEHDVADGRDLIGVQCLDQRQQRGKAARIVADAGGENGAVPFLHGHIGAFGKHRVLMRGNHQPGPAAAAALAQRDHVAFAVEGRVLEAEFLKSLEEIFAADFFLIGRCGNFGNAFLLRQRAHHRL